MDLKERALMSDYTEITCCICVTFVAVCFIII